MKRNVNDLSPEEKARYDALNADMGMIQLSMDDLLNPATIYGYARVSTSRQAKDGNSLEAQTEALRKAGATEIFTDTYTGVTTDRPELDKLLSCLHSGDTLVVTKLDRMARSTLQGLELLQKLADDGITVNVLDMGTISNQPADRLRLTMLLAFAEYERNMILQRTREGKEVARTKPGYREGRPQKYTQNELQRALLLLQDNSYAQVEKITGIPRATLYRAYRRTKNTTVKGYEL